MKPLITLFLLTVAFVMRPSRGSCADPYYVNGATPNGVYQCRTKYPYPDDCTKGGCVQREFDDSWYESRIYCTNGLVPVQDGHSVWCARRPAI